MSAPTVDIDLTITVTSATTAHASDGMTFQSLDARGLQQDIYGYAGESAEDADREISVSLVNAASGVSQTVVVSPDGTWADADVAVSANLDDSTDIEPSTATASSINDDADLDHHVGGEAEASEMLIDSPADVPDVDVDVDVDDAGQIGETWDDSEDEDRSSRRFAILDGQPRVTASVSPSGTISGRSARLRERPRSRVLSQRQRTMVVGAAGAAVLIAVGIAGGVALNSPDDSSPTAAVAAQQRPLESFSGSGPGDITSGSGVIFAYDHAYYISRDADAVARLWAPAAGVKASKLQREIDKVAKGTTHRLNIRETRDPLVYDVTLRITSPKGESQNFHQRFQLTRLDDGQYRIESSTTLP